VPERGDRPDIWGSCRLGKGRVCLGDPVESVPKPGTERAVVDCAPNLQQQVDAPSRPSQLKKLMADNSTTREQRLEAALARSVTAIDDWLNTYAPEFCDEARVKEARSRIMSEGGTLAYIADVQQQNREALKNV
jgi:hypothetical protein